MPPWLIPGAMAAIGGIGGLLNSRSRPDPMDQYRQMFAEMTRMAGPQALGQSTQQLYGMLNASPMAASMRADSAMGARAMGQGLSEQMGTNGLSSTGVGGLRAAISRAQVAHRNQAVSADIFRQASALAAQNAGQRLGTLGFNAQGIDWRSNPQGQLFAGMLQGGIGGLQSNQQAQQFQQMWAAMQRQQPGGGEADRPLLPWRTR